MNGDEGTGATPAIDTISDFEIGIDHIDLSQFFDAQPDATGTEMADFIDMREENGSTILSIKSDGTTVDQEINIENTSIDQLYGSSASGVSEADILQKMIDDQNLLGS